MGLAIAGGSSNQSTTYQAATLTAPVLSVPVARQVFQRTSATAGPITITGTYTGSYTSIQASANPINGGTFVDWTEVVAAGSSSPWTGHLTLAPGWYTLKVRVLNNTLYSLPTTLAKVGVGEVFIVAGQSLVSNGGQTRQVTTDDRISAVDRSGTWQLADDPQPGVADGLTGGSPVPLIGNLLVAKLNMPVAFLDVAYGGSSTAQWIATKYAAYVKPTLQANGVGGVRAILWEQGNTDGGLGVDTATYEANIQTLITTSRSDAGYAVAWGIADKSTRTALTNYSLIQAAQDWLVAGNVAGVFAGSDSDTIVPDADRYDGTHFNTAGEIIQARAWYNALINYFGW